MKSDEQPRGAFKEYLRRLVQDEENVNLIDGTPLLFMHVMALGVFFVSFSWTAVWVCVGLYFLRVFALTGGYTPQQLLYGLGMQLLWIVIGIVTANRVWKIAIRRYSAVGG